MQKIILILTLTWALTMSHLPKEENVLIYIGDPMCSWCYGFGPEVSTIKSSLPEGVSFEIIMGGLRPYGEQPMSELSEFLRNHWVEIGERTGQPFSLDILAQADFIYDTEPACRAVVTARTMAPSKALGFFKAVQTSFYAENKNTHEVDTYLTIADSLGLDRDKFKTLFESTEIKAATKDDFDLAGQMGVRSFPSLVLKKGSDYFLVAAGYDEAENILKTIDKVMKE